ncbi:hypothetical protein CTRI78_v008699 [Colletotrichum trifolii]|uniref:Uncharacterized protein n=1 Tax=Colletotrichum trifolii TaxID=5466 RepID=A0A4R8QUG3_COLTR|nr:hypothetical protein CTRI78_v008699 [Colletotrichum trifolii]
MAGSADIEWQPVPPDISRGDTQTSSETKRFWRALRSVGLLLEEEEAEEAVVMLGFQGTGESQQETDVRIGCV